MYDEWLSESEHQLTPQGNMRAPSRKQMIDWVLVAWKKLPAEIIKRSFKICALSSSLNGSEDQDLMCIKLGPLESLLPKLQALGNQRDEVDSFECMISEDNLAQEDSEELKIVDDDDDNIIDVDPLMFLSLRIIFITKY